MGFSQRTKTIGRRFLYGAIFAAAIAATNWTVASASAQTYYYPATTYYYPAAPVYLSAPTYYYAAPLGPPVQVWFP